MFKKETQFERRRRRVRFRLKVRGAVRPRLSVYRSSSHIYAQIIDDGSASTLVAACSLEKAFKASGLKSSSNIQAASLIGKLVAERAVAKGIKDVIFDRGGYLYHGRVKALAEAARENGLNL
jgi:large subunit ribosomal protein L18